MIEKKTDKTDVEYEVSLKNFSSVNLLKPDTQAWSNACDQLGLTSAERSFYALCKATELQGHIFKPHQLICTQGEIVDYAHLVIAGRVEIISGKQSLRVGPGAVFGLAEGIMEQTHMLTARALDVATTMAIPMSKVLLEWSRMHKGLRGIERCTVMRVLNSHAHQTGGAA